MAKVANDKSDCVSYSVRRLSELTDIPQSTLYDWVSEGLLEADQIGPKRRIRIPRAVARRHFPEIFGDST